MDYNFQEMLIHNIQGKLSGENNFLIEHTIMCNFLRGSDKIFASVKKNNTINAKIIFNFWFQTNS